MKKKTNALFVLIFTIFFLAVIYYVYKTPRAQLSVLPSASSANNPIFFPTGSDKLNAGQIYDISWAEDPNVGQVQIFLVSKSSDIIDKSYNVPNTGHFAYTIPVGIKSGWYRFEIGNLKTDYFEIINSKM